jgi:hypothetical protein
MTKAHYAATIDAAIGKARESGERESVMIGDVEFYAYPHRDGTAWGLNAPDGRNILRGVRTANDIDIGES